MLGFSVKMRRPLPRPGLLQIFKDQRTSDTLIFGCLAVACFGGSNGPVADTCWVFFSQTATSTSCMDSYSFSGFRGRLLRCFRGVLRPVANGKEKTALFRIEHMRLPSQLQHRITQLNIINQAGPHGRKRLHHLQAPGAAANEDLLPRSPILHAV